MHTGLQHIAHIDLGHCRSLISRVRPPRIPISNPCTWQKAPRKSCRYVCGLVLYRQTARKAARFIPQQPDLSYTYQQSDQPIARPKVGGKYADTANTPDRPALFNGSNTTRQLCRSRQEGSPPRVYGL
ncbi:protein of unknown function [Pseudomonas marincola]|uniref:Uncharacterized protein n=1 Tax=Pseudomonas marincola TaxID=437900 RepID=A0A8S2BKM4_9PSED|nr:protein of unknown function [Pseudomonas marincola]